MPLYNDSTFSGKWKLITDDYLLVTNNNKYIAEPEEKIIVDTNEDIIIALPETNVGEIEIFNVNPHNTINVDLQGKKYNRKQYLPSDLYFEGDSNYIKIVYLNDDIGWYPIDGEFYIVSSSYPPGMSLWIEGSYGDKSTFNRKVITTDAEAPAIVTGLDFKPVLRWSKEKEQQLRVLPFLDNTDGATLYIVFTINDDSNYTLIKTIGGNDDWFHNDRANKSGDIGVFQDFPLKEYPENMPSDGSHLISIHASLNTYEVLLDNVSKGERAGSYNPGNFFQIGPRYRSFSADMALILVYPGYISPNSFFHNNCINRIKSFYPSLPFDMG